MPTTVNTQDTRFEGTTTIAGTLVFGSSANGSIGDSQYGTSSPMALTKARHLLAHTENFGLDITATVTNEERIVFYIERATTLRAFKAGVRVAATTGTTSFDLKKNGTTILTGTVDITSADGTTPESGVLASTALVAGDVMSIEMANSSGDGTGAFAFVELDQSVVV